MKYPNLRHIIVLSLLVALFSGCVSTKSGDEKTAHSEPPPPVQEESLAEKPVAEKPAPDGSADEAPADTEPDDAESEVVEEIVEPIEVSEELYVQTFTEVETTISELNEIISRGDFSAWQYYLTPEYRMTYSDPDVLRQSSQSSVLIRNNIILRSLEDYFNYVVVPSRSNARLDDLVFLDETTVEAIMVINEQRYLLYLLKKSDDRWKIDTF